MNEMLTNLVKEGKGFWRVKKSWVSARQGRPQFDSYPIWLVDRYSLFAAFVEVEARSENCRPICYCDLAWARRARSMLRPNLTN